MPEPLQILLLSLVLSTDSFSAAFAMGYRPFQRSDALRFAFASGGAEALSAWLGVVAGGALVRRFSSVDHWIAFGLLALVAAHMAWEGVQRLRTPETPSSASGEFHGMFRILLVSFATSLDSFGVGVGFGASALPVAPFVASIGLCAFGATLGGLSLSRKLSVRFGPWMALLGSGILALIAVQMLQI